MPSSTSPRLLDRRRVVGLGIVGVLVLAACSGDDDTAEPSVPPPVTSDTLFVTTTTGAQPTTAVSTTAPTTTAETVDTTAPTSEASAPTTDSTVVDDEAQAVIDAAEASWEAFIAAIRDPGNEETIIALTETKRGDVLDATVSYIQQLIAANQRAVAHPEVPAEFVPDVESVEIAGETATIEFCWVGSDVIVELVDGEDVVVNDDVGILIERETFEIIEGSWRKVRGVNLDIIEGESSCNGRF